MKAIYLKRDNQTLFLQNRAGDPEIVLISPITRSDENSREKWRTVLEFFGESEINTLLVIDKTESGIATDYFMNHFEFKNKQLFVLPRSIQDTLFDSVGEIVLDDNMWIFQLHDDDKWNGKITLPSTPNHETVYYSDFYLYSESRGFTKFLDFSMPNRIVFSLVPSILWNRFSKLIQDQNYHVPGSFDFTYNLMARLSCKFEYRAGFIYEWKDDNWNSTKNSNNHLIGLAKRDGWKEWSSPEIANFNRSVDSLVALTYIEDFLTKDVLSAEIIRSLTTFQPSKGKRTKYFCTTPFLKGRGMLEKGYFALLGKDSSNSVQQKQVSLRKFILSTWNIRTINDLINLIIELESMNNFAVLQTRFRFWRLALNQLEKGTISDK